MQVWPYQSGTLASGGSNTVTVFIVASRKAVGRQVTVNPGGTVFTISWNRPFTDRFTQTNDRWRTSRHGSAPRLPIPPSLWGREADSVISGDMSRFRLR